MVSAGLAQGYDQMPEFFKLCVDTWRRHNPDWDIRILQKSTVHEYCHLAAVRIVGFLKVRESTRISKYLLSQTAHLVREHSLPSW